MKTKQIIGLAVYATLLLAYTCYLVIEAIEVIQQ